MEGDRKGRLSGTYIGHLDGIPAGYIHNFKTGDEIRWKASRASKETTPEEWERGRAQMAADRAAREAERSHREAVTAHKARAIWNRAKPAQEHPYLTRKGVTAHGIRQDRTGNLLVPMRDVEGRLWSVQTISQDGGKLYMKGGRKQGMHALLGNIQVGQPLVIAEGFATAATMREITGLPVAVAFDSGNLADVARAYRARDAALPIVFAADNDHHLPRKPVPLPNVGAVKAIEAAQEVGGTVLQPAFAATEAGTDWNDYGATHGKVAMRALIQAELRRQGIELPAELVKQAKASPVITQAARDAARQSATRTAPTADQAAAQQATRRAQQRPTGPRL